MCVYEQKFKSNGLLAHEQEVNQLVTEGNNLTEGDHPGRPAIQVHVAKQRLFLCF